MVKDFEMARLFLTIQVSSMESQGSLKMKKGDKGRVRVRDLKMLCCWLEVGGRDYELKNANSL